MRQGKYGYEYTFEELRQYFGRLGRSTPTELLQGSDEMVARNEDELLDKKSEEMDLNELLSDSFQVAARKCEATMKKWETNGITKLASRLNLYESGVQTMNQVLLINEINQTALFGTARFPIAKDSKDIVIVPGPQHLYPLYDLQSDVLNMKYMFMIGGLTQEARECIVVSKYFDELARQGVEFFDSPMDIYEAQGLTVAHAFIDAVLEARKNNKIIYPAPAIAAIAPLRTKDLG
jgi:hypothetical protein